MLRWISLNLTMVVLVLPNFTLAQGRFDDVEIKVTHVAGKVHMLEGAGGNIGVSAGDDGIVLIDDQFEPLAPKIQQALAKLEAGKVRFVLNTHHHGDHTGGNVVFGKTATIIAHRNVRERLGRETQRRGRTVAPTPKDGLPVVTFENAISLHFNGEEIKILHLPQGHTDGDSVVFFPESNVVHMGDHFFRDRFPFIDIDGGGSVDGYIANVARAIERLPDDVKIIPGHGALANVEDLRRFHAMLVETSQQVQKQVEAGKSLDEIQKTGLDDKWSEWGSGFISTERWIATLHRGFSEK